VGCPSRPGPLGAAPCLLPPEGWIPAMPETACGALAQLGERLICIQKVIGSIPIGSTKIRLRQILVEPVEF
jgi:hypothetical protein